MAMSAQILEGDCLTVMPTLPADSIEACVTDPPYGLRFMGKGWDHGVPGVPYWQAVLRVLKPGGHLVAFGGTRTWHRLAVAIEDAGFEIRDTLCWLYGSGFPKSRNVQWAINKAARGDDDGRPWAGWGTALKPAFEPIILARKPLQGTVAANVLAHGVGALNVDGCRVGTFVNTTPPGTDRYNRANYEQGYRPSPYGRDGEPSADRRYTDNGATNFAPTPGPRGGAPEGRWPANVLHDGSDEVLAGMPESKSCNSPSAAKPESKFRPGQGNYQSQGPIYPGDTGSAARFFYCAKASKAERMGSKHPTVKPLALMRYLVRLVTPPGGTVLDPFAGSGTTGAACQHEGFGAIMVEREPEYVADIRARVS